MLGPYVTYIGMGPGVLAQLPNLLNFCADFAVKIVLKISREIYPYDAQAWVGNSPLLRGLITPVLIVFYLVRSVIVASIITALFVPLAVGYLAKLLLNSTSEPDMKKYARVGSAPAVDMTFLLLEVNSNALAYAAALPAYFMPVLVFSWIYTFFQRGVVFIPLVEPEDGPGINEEADLHPHHLSWDNIVQWFKKTWNYKVNDASLAKRIYLRSSAAIVTFAKAIFMLVFSVPLSLLAWVEWIDRSNSNATFVSMVDQCSARVTQGVEQPEPEQVEHSRSAHAGQIEISEADLSSGTTAFTHEALKCAIS